MSLQRTVRAAAFGVIIVTLEGALAKSSLSFDYECAHYLLNTKQSACRADVTA
ncbi:MAG: hypothetical protein ACXVH8_04855 [Halobacteriota archaeon]